MDWTPARRKAFIVSVLRSGTRRWPPKYNTLNNAKTEKKVNKSTGRIAQHYLCNACKEEFPAKQVQVDHIVPVAAIDGFTTWDSFIDGLFCGEDNLQVLCTSCHSEKSKLEKKERRENQGKDTGRRRNSASGRRAKSK